jgi:hypothetical protein
MDILYGVIAVLAVLACLVKPRVNQETGHVRLARRRRAQYRDSRAIARRGQVVPRERKHDPVPWCNGFCDGTHPRERHSRHPMTGEILRRAGRWEEVSGTKIVADHRGKAWLAVIFLAVLFIAAVYFHVIHL